MKTQTHMIGTTTAEAEVLAATAALLADGKDPFGDDDESPEVEAASYVVAEADGSVVDTEVNPDDAAPEAETEVKDPEAEGAEALSAEALAAIAADDDSPAPAEPSKRYNAGDPAEFKAKRDEQNTIKAKALKDLMEGVIEPEEYSRIEAEVADNLEALAVRRTLHEANVQTERQTQESALDKIITAAKKAGEVDYLADAKAAKQFDTAMKLLADDGEARTYAELAADAHKAVLAIRGIKKAETPAATPAPAPAQPRENGRGPMTLRTVPAAETPNSGGGWQEALNTLSGQAYEDAFAKLTPGQRAQLMND